MNNDAEGTPAERSDESDAERSDDGSNDWGQVDASEWFVVSQAGIRSLDRDVVDLSPLEMTVMFCHDLATVRKVYEEDPGAHLNGDVISFICRNGARPGVLPFLMEKRPANFRGPERDYCEGIEHLLCTAFEDGLVEIGPTEDELKLLVSLMDPSAVVLWSPCHGSTPLQLCLSHPSYSDELKEFMLQKAPENLGTDEFIVQAGPICLRWLQKILPKMKSFKIFSDWETESFLEVLRYTLVENTQITSMHLRLPPMTFTHIYKMEELLGINEDQAKKFAVEDLSLDFSGLQDPTCKDAFISVLALLPQFPRLQNLAIDVGDSLELAIDTICRLLDKGVLNMLKIYCRPARTQTRGDRGRTTRKRKRQSHENLLMHRVFERLKKQNNPRTLSNLLIYGVLEEEAPHYTSQLVSVLEKNTDLKILGLLNTESEGAVMRWRENVAVSCKWPLGFLDGTSDPPSLTRQEVANFDWLRSSHEEFWGRNPDLGRHQRGACTSSKEFEEDKAKQRYYLQLNRCGRGEAQDMQSPKAGIVGLLKDLSDSYAPRAGPYRPGHQQFFSSTTLTYGLLRDAVGKWTTP